MLPVYAQLARRETEKVTASALPHAPVLAVTEPAPATGTRRAVASGLLALADRISPEPVERSRWQTG